MLYNSRTEFLDDVRIWMSVANFGGALLDGSRSWIFVAYLICSQNYGSRKVNAFFLQQPRDRKRLFRALGPGARILKVWES